MAVNLRGAYIAIKAAVPLMGKGGRIINLSSTFGARVPAPGIGLYAISKFAVAGMTRAFARDLASLRHHGECDPARSHRHGNKSRRQPPRPADGHDDGAWPLWRAGGCRRHRGFPGERRQRIHHRRDLQRRWRVSRRSVRRTSQLLVETIVSFAFPDVPHGIANKLNRLILKRESVGKGTLSFNEPLIPGSFDSAQDR